MASLEFASLCLKNAMLLLPTGNISLSVSSPSMTDDSGECRSVYIHSLKNFLNKKVDPYPPVTICLVPPPSVECLMDT